MVIKYKYIENGNAHGKEETGSYNNNKQHTHSNTERNDVEQFIGHDLFLAWTGTPSNLF